MQPALFQPFPMLAGRRAQSWRHQPAFRRPRHFHPEPELNLVLRGSALLSVGRHLIAAEKGQLLSFMPGQDHVLLDASPDLELFVIALRSELADRLPDLRRRNIRSIQRLPEALLSHFAAALNALPDIRDETCVETALVDVFNAAARAAPSQDALSRRALAHIHEDPGCVSAELVRRLKTAPSVLSRRFHDETGVTFVEFRARQRLMQFVRGVDAGESFTRAALTAGFGSYAQCYRVFARSLGCCPNAYFAGARRTIDDSLAKFTPELSETASLATVAPPAAFPQADSSD